MPRSFLSRRGKLWSVMYTHSCPWGQAEAECARRLLPNSDFPILVLLSPGDTYVINHFHLNPWLWVGFCENLTSTDGQMSELVTVTGRIYVMGMEGAGSHHSRPGSKLRVWISVASWSGRHLGRDGKTRVWGEQWEQFFWTVMETDDSWPGISSRSIFLP